MMKSYIVAKNFKAPVPELSSFTAFVLYADILNKDGTYKCKSCEGWKKVKDYDNYDRDPVEGYKFCPYITCPTCKGTGVADKSYWMAIYKNKKELLKEKRGTIKAKVALDKEITSKLNENELVFLRRNGYNYDWTKESFTI